MLHLSADGIDVVVDAAAGGRIRSIAALGHELLVAQTPAATAMEFGLFPMAPFAGRVRRGRFRFEGVEHDLPINLAPHAIHGTLLEVPWAVVEADRAACTLAAELVAPWPFPGRVLHQVEVAAGLVRLRLEVHATGGAMPVSCGWHPWWRRSIGAGGPLEVDLDVGTLWPRDGDGIPTGAKVAAPPLAGRTWDDCFCDVRRPPVLRWPGALEATLHTACPDLVLFTEPVDAVCLEPQTGPPDALNLGPQVAVPGHPVVADLEVVVRPVTA